MKILMTGCTPKQVRPQPTFQYFASTIAFYDALTKGLGHDVDWRHVLPGEDLSSYDFALVGLHCLGSSAARRYKFGALWAASQVPHLPMINDWRVKQILSTLRNSLYLWKCDHLDDSSYEKWYIPAKEHRREIENVRYQWEHHLDKVLVQMHDWASPNDFVLSGHDAYEVYQWDPDPWFDPTEQYGEPELTMARERVWTLSALSPQEEWLESLGKLEWPVREVFAPASSRAIGGLRKKGQFWALTPEPELAEAYYKKEWGMLLPDYGIACLPGWWRNRYKLAAHCGCILATTTRREHHHLASYDIHPAEIEQMSTAELVDLRDRQRQDLSYFWTNKEESAQRLQTYIDDPCAPVTP